MPPKKDEYTDETLESVPNDATTFICGIRLGLATRRAPKGPEIL